MTFTANGEYLVVSNYDGAWLWRVRDAKQMATIKLHGILALALSNDEEWIAAGTSNGLFFLDAKTHEKVSTHKEDTWFYAVDFSPDSTRVVGGSRDGFAAVWAVTSGKQVQRLHHSDWVKAAKYSLQRGSNCNSHRTFHQSLGHQRWPLGRHSSRITPGAQHQSPLVQQPPLCRIRR